MKNKKGFTLVELLAVIIVLIIIMLIALNVIRTSTKKAKDNTVRANAIAFIKAVDDMIDGSDNQYEYDGSVMFSIQDLYDKGLKMSGTQPDGGYLSILNGEIVFGCLTYNKFYVNYSNNEVSQPKKGVCKGDINASFAYTGDEQSFTAAIDGVYKLEVWGAQGGNSHDPNVFGGYGGYSVGYISLNKGDKLYINVGEQGQNVTSDPLSKSYNGGASCRTAGASMSCGNGGGATSISFKSGLLNTLNNNVANVVIVAGGGGGASTHQTDTTNSGGTAGGYIGSSGSSNKWGFGTGGTQSTGGARATTSSDAQNGTFGLGGNGALNAGAGGGGGFYGGGGGHGGSAGGGSGYIGYYKLFNGVMFCYNCASTNIPTMITNVTTCISEEPTENCAKQGSGYAKISYTGGADLAKDYKYLYSSGNEFNSITGGWVATNSQGNGRTEKLANNLHIYCSNTGQSSSNYTTANAIVNDGYTKLHVVYEISRQLVSNQYSHLYMAMGSAGLTSPNMAVGIYHETLNISSVTSGKVTFSNSDGDMKILQVWLAKD